MQHDLFGFQERGHGWLRLLGDLRVGGILADDMGLGKTVQAIATLVSERDGVEHPLPPTLVVTPMSVTQQWAREIARFAPGLRVHLHHGPSRLVGRGLRHAARESDVVVTSYDVATRDVDTLAEVQWDRLLLDEAQDAKNPTDEATSRAPAHPATPCARPHRDTDREPARRALGDHGPRQPGPARLPRVVRADVRAPDRAPT